MKSASRIYRTAILNGLDTYVAAAAGALAGYLMLDAKVRDAAVGVVITEAAVGVAVTATVFGAVAVFATFFDGPYRRVLELAGGFQSALSPYVVVGVVAAAAGVVGLIVALALPELGQTSAAAAVGVSSFLCAWSLTGTVSLVRITLFHAGQRAKLLSGADEAARIIGERRSPRRAS